MHLPNVEPAKQANIKKVVAIGRILMNDTRVRLTGKAIRLSVPFLQTLRFRPALLVCTLLAISLLQTSIYSQDLDESDEWLYRLEFDREEVSIPCDKGCRAIGDTNQCTDAKSRSVDVNIRANEDSLDAGDLWYEFDPDAGLVIDGDSGIRWDLSEASEGTYWLRVKINRGFETIDVINKSIEVKRCDCLCTSSCATFKVGASKEAVGENEIILFRAVRSGYFSSEGVDLNWNVENGEIVSGTGSSILKVRAGSSAKGYLKVTVETVQATQECRRVFEILVPVSK